MWIHEDDGRLHATEQTICCRKLLSTSLVKASDLLCIAALFPVIHIFKSCLCTLDVFAHSNHQQTVIPQIYRLSVVLPLCPEISLTTKRLHCVFCGACLSLWGLNTRLTPFKEVNRKRSEKGFYICHVARKLFLPSLKFHTKCISPEPMQLPYLFSCLYTFVGIFVGRYLSLKVAENSNLNFTLKTKPS